MLTLITVGVVGALLGLARGGTVESLSATRLRRFPLVLIGLALQLLFEIWQPEWLSEPATIAILIVSDVLVLAFVVSNWRTPGILLVGLGFALNALVITANAGMPVSDSAAEAVGMPRVEEEQFKHERLSEDTTLPWLGDVIPLPLIPEVLSIGDVALALGIGWLVYARTVAGRESSAQAKEEEVPGRRS